MADNKIVDSKAFPLKTIFSEKYTVDFYQREYVWQTKQIEDLVTDLSTEFLKNWKPGDATNKVSGYDPYFMGEIVLSLKGDERSAIIDGQQRITTLTLFLIFLKRRFGGVKGFPSNLDKLIYDDYYGEQLFNLDIEERRDCMLSLYQTGHYDVKSNDSPSVQNMVDRYEDFDLCWNDKIDENNIVSFVYWVMEKIIFSKVWTNSDEFAYVIFETMNDRGLSLTQVEMLRSYLLANIDTSKRDKAMQVYDNVVRKLTDIKLSSKSKAEFEFFKLYFRGHYAKDFSQAKNSTSDFVRIGKEFHRWVRDNSVDLGLNSSADFIDFIDRVAYFADIYEKINRITVQRNTNDFLYLIVNSDYGFTLQPALILTSVNYKDSDSVVDNKIKLVSKYLTKVLTWRVWNHWMISQSAMEASVYELCKDIRGMDVDSLEAKLKTDPIEIPNLSGMVPTLNHQNRRRLTVLVALITEIVACNSGESNYMLNQKEIELEHIWANHFEDHTDEFASQEDFANVRNNIGDLLVLPKSFNASYNDDPYSSKVQQYFSQNILAQSLNSNKYQNAPGFSKFISDSGLKFEAYSEFKRENIQKRAELYRAILEWNWQ